MSWIITYPPEYYLQLGGEEVQTRPAPNFNGVSQYGVLPDIPIPDDGFFMSGKFRAKSLTGNQTIFWGGIVDFQFRLQGSTGARLSWFNGTQHAALISGLTLEIDEEYTFTIETLGASGIRLTLGASQATNSDAVSLQALVSEQQLGRRNSGEFFNGLVYDVLINDGSVYNFPMDDGWTNNPTMRNTSTGADGTFVNMTEAAWVEIPA